MKLILSNTLLISFFICAITNLIAENQDSAPLIFITKPLLLFLLAAWVFIAIQPINLISKRLLLAGMLFSCLGDILLMFQENDGRQSYFIFGLASFLIAQINYGFSFLKIPSDKPNLIQRKPFSLLPFAIFLLVFLTFLWSGLTTELKTPVIFYSLAISFMAISALSLFGKISNNAAYLIFIGALIFMLSDCLLAINKFKMPLAYAREAIMLTYLIGQFCIAFGSKKAFSQVAI